MGKTIMLRVDESLPQVLERIRREVAEDMKRMYHLKSPDKADALALCFYEPAVHSPAIRWL